MITAEEARAQIFLNKRTSTFEEIERSIEKAIENSESEVYVKLVDGEELEDHEIKIIEDLGYNINWNRACLWYEISW